MRLKARRAVFVLFLLLAAAAHGAVEFNGSTQYISGATPATAAQVFSVSMMQKSDIGFSSGLGTSLAIVDGSVDDHYYRMTIGASDIITWQVRQGAPPVQVTTAASSVDTWHVIGASEGGATSHVAYLDGGNKGSSATSSAPANIDTLAVGALADNTVSGWFDGSCAWLAAWAAVLTDGEHAALGQGFDPMLIRPGSLTFYAPLIRGDWTDKVGGIVLTGTGSPTEDSANPRIFRGGFY